MDSPTLFFNPLYLFFLSFILAPIAVSGANSNLFVEYIGAQFTGVKFSNVPINSRVNFHFILFFAIDYTDTTKPTPTNGKFGVFWDGDNLSPNAVSTIKQKHSNVKVAVSLGGDSIGDNTRARFTANSVKSRVRNAVSSVTNIIQKYHLDDIDIDYEHFSDEEDIETFTECIGQLITILKRNGVISFASIAPFIDPTVQSMYTALWSKYSSVIDYVNFQFYGYDNHTTVDQYVRHYDEQVSNYPRGKVLASFTSDTTGPEDGEFQPISPDIGYSACKKLKSKGKLFGIFIWSADNSQPDGFTYEKKSQTLLASDSSEFSLPIFLLP